MVSSSDISVPSGSITFTPLYSGGLCDAVIMAPPENRPVVMMYCSAGVGRMPRSSTSQPVVRSPALRAWLRASPDVLVSLPTAIVPFLIDPSAAPIL